MKTLLEQIRTISFQFCFLVVLGFELGRCTCQAGALPPYAFYKQGLAFMPEPSWTTIFFFML
jgi:hypothetical protein